jgi:hypothetical protein
MLPKEDEKGVTVDIIKEQILDLNDKFDYILFLLMKQKQIEKEDHGFKFKTIIEHD